MLALGVNRCQVSRSAGRWRRTAGGTRLALPSSARTVLAAGIDCGDDDFCGGLGSGGGSGGGEGWGGLGLLAPEGVLVEDSASAFEVGRGSAFGSVSSF